MWSFDLSKRDQNRINTRRLNKSLQMPSTFYGETCYADDTNRERNAISAGISRGLILGTHPLIDSNTNEDKRQHTIIVRANVRSSLKSSVHIDRVIRDRIIATCSDDNVKVGHKHIDPALFLYIWAYIICTGDNKYLADKVPIVNGTVC